MIGTKISHASNKYYLRNMINEKELRVGNAYLSKRNKDVLVRGIDTINKLVVIEEPDLNAGKEQPYIFEDLAPIPLTKDTIASFGFITGESGEGVFLKKIDCEKDCAFIEFQEDGCFLKDKEHNKIGKQISYVHQLQNTYFLLTGTELF
jgi:hypothetical protein